MLPFELLLLSYAILGPAHYFTEISWLHDRRYFLPHRGFAVALAALALGAMFLANSYLLGVLLWLVFLGCAIAATVPSPRRAALYGTIAVALTGLMVVGEVPFGLAWILLPTLIHVSVFTLVFMTLGALRAQQRRAVRHRRPLSLAIAVIVLLPPSERTVIPALARWDRNISAASRRRWVAVRRAGPAVRRPRHRAAVLRLHLSLPQLVHQSGRHPLGADSRARGSPASSCSARRRRGFISTTTQIGFMVLLLISLLHVLLEFPLNGIAIGQLGAALGRTSRRAPVRAISDR